MKSCVESLKRDNSTCLAPAICEYLLQTMNIINHIQTNTGLPHMKGLLHDIRKLVSRVNGKYFEVKAKQELSQRPSLTSVTKPQESPFKNNFHWGNPGTDNGSPPVFTSFPSMNVKIDPKGIASQSGMMGGWPAIKPPATDTAAPTSKNGEEDEDEEPPKHEFTPVVEDDAVYSKRCKLFEKREGSFKERGIGVLYINELKTGKYQIVIRADNTLGTVLMNTHLNSAIPVQKSGKNNVLTVDPTGDGGKAISVLIRVKTGEDADELIEKLNEFKNVRLKT